VEQKEQYLYGPVPSRRLGLSLGIDIVPFKVCNLDCVYCQLGRTTQKSIERKEFIPAEDVLSELKNRIAEGLTADYITFSGSGEPTLNLKLGELITGAKKITKIPVAVLTNGTLLYMPDVRTDCSKADLILPSLDAGDQKTFEKINRPHPDINIEKVISGLCELRKQFAGQIWLEVFLVDSINTEARQLSSIKRAIELIRPDKIQLNTAVRPTADASVKPPELRRLRDIADFFGPKCEIIADMAKLPSPDSDDKDTAEKSAQFSADDTRAMETLLSMLKRRPCSLDDISSSLGFHRNQAVKYLTCLEQSRLISSERKNGIIFYKAI